ncbi:MAG: aspartyl protease family protein [Planctomycetes bacterium]|nr:aspartyl protease family protein [Planctomycetota bacterium]
MTRGRALLAVCALAGCAARTGGAALDPLGAASAMRAALAVGDVDYAERVLSDARARHPRDVGLLVWGAVLNRVQWRDVDAVDDLLSAVELAGEDAELRSELAGRLGLALFRAGRYAEARTWLAQADPEGGGRPLARLCAELPFARAEPAATATELPLLARRPPVMLCRVGDRDAPLVLDTGASWTTLTRGFADVLGLRSDSAPIDARDATGRDVEGRLTVVRSLSVGTLELATVPALIVADERLRLPQDDADGAPSVCGVVGFDVLERFRFTLDPERGSLLLEPRRGLPPTRSVACLRSRSSVLVPVKIEAARHWFVLDTGASRSSLTPAGLARLPGGATRAEPDHSVVRTVGGRSVAVRTVRGLTLDIAAARFAGVELPVVARDAPGATEDDGPPIDGVLGVDLLLRCRATFDGGWLRLESPR